MDTTRQFLLTLFAWILFAVGAFTFLSNEQPKVTEDQSVKASHTAPARYSGTMNLNQVSGEQVVGMIPYALEGHYVLTIDGVTISSYTDITTIDLRGMPGLTYTLNLNRTNGIVTSINATH